MLFSTPGVVAVGVTAPVLVPFLIGDQWAPAAPIFAWLTLAALHRPVSMTMDLLFISQGRTRDYMIWSVLQRRDERRGVCHRFALGRSGRRGGVRAERSACAHAGAVVVGDAHRADPDDRSLP